jgi:hypothetical protein
MKSPAEFRVQLAWIVKVKPSEGEAVVEQHSPIRYIQGGE